MKLFNKVGFDDKVTYYVPDGTRTKRSIHFVPSGMPAMVQKELDPILNHDEYSGLTRINDNLIYISKESKITPSDMVELPFGTYEFNYTNDEIGHKITPITMREERAVCNQELFAQLKRDIELFIKSKSVYSDLGIIAKRGYLLYGEPGTGKTSFIRHMIGNLFKDNAHIIWMNEVPYTYICKVFSQLPSLKVFIIEEVTSKNQNPSDVKRLLEFLDGENSISNTIVIATTNYPEELKKNLADRPSRFDVVAEIKAPEGKEALAFYEFFLKRAITSVEVPLTGLTVSHIKEVCLLHKMYGADLLTCHKKVLSSRTKFKKQFLGEKEMGFGKIE